MAELRGIRLSLFLTLLLQSTATAATGQYSSFTVRAGGAVALPCENAICESTTWVFSESRNTVELVTLGKIQENSRSDRLSVAADCSLVIKNVTIKDAGRYDCQQYRSGQQQGEDRLVHLSVLTMTGHEDGETATLSCCLWSHESFRHTVKWVYEGKQVDEDKTQTETLQSHLRSVTFYHLKQSSKYQKLFVCEVTDGFNSRVQQFPFSAAEPAVAATTATTKRTTVNGKSMMTNSTGLTLFPAKPAGISLWLYSGIAVGLVTFFIIIVLVCKGNKKQADENTERLSLNPAVTRPTPETTQDVAELEDGVSYASVSYNKKTTSEGRVKNDGDEGDAVTYSTVKASSSSAVASDDPSALYATIKKSDK